MRCFMQKQTIIFSMILSLFIIGCRGTNDTADTKAKLANLEKQSAEQKVLKEKRMAQWSLPKEFTKNEVTDCKIELKFPSSAELLDLSILKSPANSLAFFWVATGEACSGEYYFRYFGNKFGDVIKLSKNLDKAFGSVSKRNGYFYFNKTTIDDVNLEPNPEGLIYWNVEDAGSGAQSDPGSFKVKEN